MLAIVVMGIVFSVSGLVVGHMIPTADATRPGHKQGGSGIGDSGPDVAAALQLTTTQGSIIKSQHVDK